MPSPPTIPSVYITAPTPPAPPWWRWPLGAASGLALAAGINVLADAMLDWKFFVTLLALCLFLCRRRMRFGLLHAAVFVWFVIALLWQTPLMGVLVNRYIVRDALRHAPAIVVLGGDIHIDGRPMPVSQRRLNYGYSLVGQGYSATLVLTRLPPPRPSYVPFARRQLAQRNIEAKIIESPVVTITHDEAVQVAALAKKHGWPEVLLVSDALHMRRAAALFRKAGLNVICAPCQTAADLPLMTPHERGQTFHLMMREWIILQEHRRRGWA